MTPPAAKRLARLRHPVVARCGVALLGGALERLEADADAWLSRALRRERRLGSVPRRLVADAIHEALRRWPLLELLLLRGGWDGARRVEALWEAALIRSAGRAPADAGAAFGAEVFGAFAEPGEAVRAWIREQTPDEAASIAALASLPADFARRLVAERADARTLAAALGQRAPMTLRVSPRLGREAALAALAEAGVSARSGALCADAVVIEGRVHLPSLDLFRRGLVEVQDEGSQLVAALVDPPRDGLTVDFCAGAGGKSLALAARGARVHALDVRAGALAEAQKRAKRARLRLRTTRIDADGPLPIAAGSAARVLVDAPCTGSGVIRRHPGSRWRVTDARVAEACALQRRILDRAAPLVAPGGRLIYATCSLLADENQRIADAFMAAHRGWSLGAELATDPTEHGADGFYARVFKRD